MRAAPRERALRRLDASEPAREKRLELIGLRGRKGLQEAVLVAHVVGERSIDEGSACRGERDDASPSVVAGGPTRDQARLLEAVDPLGHGSGGHHGEPGELAGRALERLPGTAESGEHVELALAESVTTVDGAQLLGEMAGEAMQSPDHPLR